MKLFNKILLGAAAITVIGAFSSCKEEDTLGGADAVYIEMANPNMTLLVGDSVKLSARVSNVSGRDINAPITWSVDDESVAKLIEVVDTIKVKNPTPAPVPNPGSPDDEGNADNNEEGNNDSDDQQTPDSRADLSGVPDGYDGISEDGKILYKFVKTPGIKAMAGAQGRTTNVRATLENGQFAMATVTVGRNALANCVKAEKEEIVTYNDFKNDVVWFDLNSVTIVDDYPVSFAIEYLEKITEAKDPAERDFVYPSNDYVLSVFDEDNQEHTIPVKDGIAVDTERSRVGVVFTAPRMTGKAKVTLTVGTDEENVKASTLLWLFPRISGGLEYISNGEVHRPLATDANPSNTKPRMTTVQMDINSSYLIGCCLGNNVGTQENIDNMIAAERAGYFKWTIDGSAVVVEDQFIDEDYLSGYVTYLKVRAGSREGATRCQFYMPGESPDTDDDNQIFTVDVTVANFDKSYPVEDIIITDEWEHAYNEGDLVEAYIGTDLRLNVNVEPDASFTYHIPEITSSDPSILEVVERGAGDGLTRQFKTHKLGTVTLTFKSLDVTKTIRVRVNDKVTRIGWNNAPSYSLTVGNPSSCSLSIYLASNPAVPATVYDGDVVWTTSDASVLTVTPDPGNISATLTPVAPGEATITATVAGIYTVSQTVKVAEATTTVISGEVFTDCPAWLEDGYLYMLCISDDGDEYQFGYECSEFTAGHFTGSGSLFLDIDHAQYEITEYDFTVTDNGDGTFTINGTFTADNGNKFEVKNIVFYEE